MRLCTDVPVEHDATKRNSVTATQHRWNYADVPHKQSGEASDPCANASAVQGERS